MNKTLANPYYLFSFQHIASKERISFYPQVITSNVRYDKFRFVEAPTTNLSLTPPQVFFEYIGQYYYSIYENITSGSTDISLAYNKLESGRAWVIVGNDDLQECLFEPYISNDEDFAQVIYVSEEEENCIYPTPSITPSPTGTPVLSPTPTPSLSPSPTFTPTPSITPSPTFTPTPSSTPAPINPNTYNAIWWLDYSNSNYLTLNGNNIEGAQNRTGNPNFSGKTGFGKAQWSSTGFNGVSGSTTPQGEGLSSLSGDYTSTSAYTHFFYFRGDDGTSAVFNQSEIGMTDYSGNSQGYRWFSLDDYNPSPPNQIRTYTFYVGGASCSPEPDYQYSANTWYAGAVRVYQSGTSATIEMWINGSIVNSTTQTATIITANTPIFNVVKNGGGDIRLTEQFFFDYALNTSEMSDMFTYLSNKY